MILQTPPVVKACSPPGGGGLPLSGTDGVQNLLVAARVDRSNGHRTCLVAGGGVRLSVADTGEGIAPADLPYVFERLYRSDRARPRSADEQGTGLGLAIARSIVEAHGGTIEVESGLGQGAVFSFCLPIHREQSPRRESR